MYNTILSFYFFSKQQRRISRYINMKNTSLSTYRIFCQLTVACVLILIFDALQVVTAVTASSALKKKTGIDDKKFTTPPTTQTSERTQEQRRHCLLFSVKRGKCNFDKRVPVIVIKEISVPKTKTIVLFVKNDEDIEGR